MFLAFVIVNMAAVSIGGYIIGRTHERDDWNQLVKDGIIHPPEKQQRQPLTINGTFQRL